MTTQLVVEEKTKIKNGVQKKYKFVSLGRSAMSCLKVNCFIAF